jgi:hypothetical protein
VYAKVILYPLQRRVQPITGIIFYALDARAQPIDLLICYNIICCIELGSAHGWE